ncbi:MAG: O-antigen ligase family protein [Paracoccaceae bacterium]
MATFESPSPISRASGVLGRLAALRVGKLPPLVWLYLFTVAVPIAFNVGSLSLSLMRVLLIVMTIPLIAMLFSGRAGKVLPTDILFGLHMVWAIIAIGVNSPSRVVENMGSTGIEFVGGYLLGRMYIRTPEQFMALFRALFVMVLVLVPFALYENRTGDAPVLDFIRDTLHLGTFADVSMPKRMGLERPQVVFAHPIHYGVFCSLTFAMCYVGFRETFATGQRMLFAAVIAMSVFLSLSSGALLAVVMQCSLIFWAYLFRNNPARWKILFGLLAFFYVVIDLLSNRTPIDVFMTYATFSPHTAYWRKIIFDWGMINVWANPVFGLGLRNWVRPRWMGSGSMDNFWLVMAVRYGIPGFLLIAAGYLDLLRRIALRKLDADPGVARIRLAWMFTLIGLTFSLSTVSIWTAAYSFVFFLVGSGVWLTSYEPKGLALPAEAPPQAGGLRFSRRKTDPVFTRDPQQSAPADRNELRHSRSRADLAPKARPEAEPPARREDLRFTRYPRNPGDGHTED